MPINQTFNQAIKHWNENDILFYQVHGDFFKTNLFWLEITLWNNRFQNNICGSVVFFKNLFQKVIMHTML